MIGPERIKELIAETKRENDLAKLGAYLLEEAQKAKAWYDERGMKVTKPPTLPHGTAIQIIKHFEWLQKHA